MSAQTKHVLLGKRNQVTLPKEFVAENIAMYECERLEDGTIVLTPQISIPARQAYFWTPRWQKGEKAASDDIKQGRLTRFPSSNKLFNALAKRRKRK
jgi:antitoxin PrlF